MVTNHAVTTFSILLIEIRFVNCHLKNLGELKDETFLDGSLGITGGEVTELRLFSHNVLFLNMGMCAGTILNFKTVLTAAHCFDLNENLAEMRVFSNSRYVFDRSANEHEVWDFMKHEEYNIFGPFSNDIAVIIIHDTFQYGPTVQKAFLCTTKQWMNENERSFYAAGWGETEYNGKASQQGLLKTTLRFISQTECERIGNFTLHPGTFCLFGDGERDTCRGDSGGAIIWKGMVVGIVSHGSGCANNFPSMYTNVPLYISWIEATVLKLHRKFCNFHRNIKITNSMLCRW